VRRFFKRYRAMSAISFWSEKRPFKGRDRKCPARSPEQNTRVVFQAKAKEEGATLAG
jgi:hypothetical protein